MANVPDLDLYFKDYGNYWTKQNGGSCDRISYLVPGYEEYRMTITNDKTEYYSDPKKSIVPALADEEEFINDTSLEQTQTYTVTRTTTNTYNWTQQTGFKISTNVKFSISVPPIASGETSITTQLDSSVTEQYSSSETKTYSLQQPLRVPPRTRVVVTLYIDRLNVSQPFHTECTFGGYIATMSPNRIMGHYIWFHSVAAIFDQFPLKNFTVDGSQVNYKGDGTFSGLFGYRVRLKIVEYPLSSNTPSKTYEIPNPIVCAGVAPMYDFYSQYPCTCINQPSYFDNFSKQQLDTSGRILS